MEQQDMNILINWRDKEISLKVDVNTNFKELGEKLQELTNVKPETMRLFVPNSSNKGVKMLSPFSDVYSGLILKETAITEGKPIKMMGVSIDEIEEVSENNNRQDLRILSFDDEEKRLKQRAMHKPQTSLKLPQGLYIFCEFQPLHIPGITLNPPPSEALRRMHMLACDPGIIAIMNKHRWRVGIMTEMAPEGYVGISPKCILGFNKNHGEEISLRLRTDDLKGFRKYESIKKTLLHELAHMVFSEHDSNFFALNKQLNDEAESLDWTKLRSHTLGGPKLSNYYEEDVYIEESSSSRSQRLGGRSDPFANPRSSSVAAAYNRLVNSFSQNQDEYQGEDQHIVQKDGLELRGTDNNDIEMSSGQEHGISEPDSDYRLKLGNDTVNRNMEINNKSFSDFPMTKEEPDPDASIEDRRISEPDPDDSRAMSTPAQHNGPNTDDSSVDDALESTLVHNSNLDEVNLKIQNIAEPDPDDSVNVARKDLEMDDLHVGKNYGEPDPDDSIKDVVFTDSTQIIEEPAVVDQDDNFLDYPELQRIEESTAIICARLQKAIDMLRAEVTPSQAITALQTLSKIIRNVIEHPNETKFRKLRKANPQFQRNVVNYKAAMEVLMMVGFAEDVISDEVGRAETFLVLRRNDPGLLWLAKSSLEVSITYVAQSA